MRGGIAKFSDLLLESLAESGCEVQPLPFRSIYPGFLDRTSPDTSSTALAERGPDDGIVLYNPLTWFRPVRTLKSMDPDVVLMAYWTGFLVPLYFLVSAMSRRKCVVLLHNYSSHEPWFFERFMQKLLNRFPDAFITISGTVDRELEAAIPGKPRLKLYHPVYEPAGKRYSRSEARRELGLGPDGPVLLFFGYVRRYKGLDLLLDAMPALLRSEPTLRLVVAGQFFEDPAPYREMITRSGISDKVTLHEGYVPAERTGLYFAAADAVVLPYRSATQSGVVQLAGGYGLPVIVTPAGELPGMVLQGRTGWIASEASAQGIAAAVEEFLSARPDLEAMRQEIASFNSRFSWSEFARKAAEFLERQSGRG